MFTDNIRVFPGNKSSRIKVYCSIVSQLLVILFNCLPGDVDSLHKLNILFPAAYHSMLRQTRPWSRSSPLINYSIPISTSLQMHSTISAAKTKTMPLASVRAVAFPSESKLRSSYKSAYFTDAFAVSLCFSEHKSEAKKYNPDAHALARALFPTSPPTWFSLLMWIRDRVMSIFGVRRSTEIQAAAEKAGIETISIFPIISRAENEIIVGENDSHLDFQTSILIRENQRVASADDGYRDDDRSGKEMVVTTVVHCHGLLGKAYITIIKPFHAMIVKYNLARVPNRFIKGN